MLDVTFVRRLITTTLDGLPFPDMSRAVPLLLGTAIAESALVHTRQVGGGPARGIFQMEPTTERDHWRWLNRHTAYADALKQRCLVEKPNVAALEYNLVYQICMARLHYFVRDPGRLPAPEALAEQAELWKRVYNTPRGAGTVGQYILAWKQVVTV